MSAGEAARKEPPKIARTAAASAAAMAITTMARACPRTSPWRRAKARTVRLAAFIMSSIDMRTMSALRRKSTPTTPMAKSTAARARKWWIPRFQTTSLTVRLVLGVRHHQRPDHRDEQDHRHRLEGEEVAGEELPAHRPGGAELARGRAARRRHLPEEEDQAAHEVDEGRPGDPLADGAAQGPGFLLLLVQDHHDEDEEHHHRP